MHKANFGMVLGCALLASSGSAQSALKAENSQIRVVPLYQSARGALAVITIAGGLPTSMIFDTCAGSFSIEQSVADRLQLRVVGSEESTDGATGRTEVVPLVEIPHLKISDVSVGTIKAQRRPYGEPDVIGLFSPSIFADHLVTLEFGSSRMRLSDPTSHPDGRAHAYKDGLPAASITVAGIAMNAFLDSGNTAEFTLPKRMMSKLSFIEAPREVGRATSVTGTQPVYRGKIRGDIRVGPLVLHNPTVGFLSDQSEANVGLPILRQLTFAIDPRRQMTWIFDPGIDRLPITSYAGRYGDYAVRASDGMLSVQRNSTSMVYRPLGSGLFENAETGYRIQFLREDKRILGLNLIRPEGNVTSASRGVE